MARVKRRGRPRKAGVRRQPDGRPVPVPVREAAAPTQERLSYGDVRLIVANEGRGRQAGWTKVYRSMPDWSSLDLTEDQRWAALRMRSAVDVPLPGVMPNPYSVGGGGGSDGPQATEAGLAYGRAARLLDAALREVGKRHARIVVSVILSGQPLRLVWRAAGYETPQDAAQAIRSALQRVYDMKGIE